MVDRERLTEDVKRHEGHSATVYVDSVGVATIGWGRNLKAVSLSQDEVLAITEGTADHAQLVRALFNGIPMAASQLMLEHDLDRAVETASRLVPGFNSLDPIRAEALVNMALNLGNRLGKFKLMLAAVGAKNWPEAKRQALDSRWAEQVGHRAVELADRLEKGMVALA